MISRLIGFAVTVLCVHAFADGLQAPPPFSVPGQTELAIFVDFDSATYNIQFDINKQKVRVHSEITFTATTEGLPVFDLADIPISVTLDGVNVSTIAVDLGNGHNSQRVILKGVKAGEHVITVEHEISGEFVEPQFSPGKVNSGFFMSDNSGAYLQNYLPTTFEFSQYEMLFNVSLVGSSEEHSIFTNGEITKIDQARWSIKYPKYFNTSALYFHLIPTGDVKQIPFSFDDGSGNIGQGIVYKKLDNNVDLNRFVDEAQTSLQNLISRFGKFPYSKVIIYCTDYYGGGMEYSGATITSLRALKHELAHSYFGRGIMPANGNSGWIDEALATYASRLGGVPNPGGVRRVNMANHSPYYTRNDGYGYQDGLNVLTRIGQMFELVPDNWDSLEKFLKSWVPLRMYQTITTEVLQADLESFGQIPLGEEFSRYVYGRSDSGEAIDLLTIRPTHSHGEVGSIDRKTLQALQ